EVLMTARRAGFARFRAFLQVTGGPGPERECSKRRLADMTVYLAALDESQNKAGDYTMGGWVGREDDWDNHFIPAWRDRILLPRKNRIPYLHMADIWSADWQEEHGITGSDAYWAVEEAATVIGSTGCLYPITSGMKLVDFENSFALPLEKIAG